MSDTMYAVEVTNENLINKMTLNDMMVAYSMAQMEELPVEVRTQMEEVYWALIWMIEKNVVCSDKSADVSAEIDDDGYLVIRTSYCEECQDVPIIQTDVDDFIEQDVCYDGEYEGVFGPESCNLTLIDLVKLYNKELESDMEDSFDDACEYASEHYWDKE